MEAVKKPVFFVDYNHKKITDWLTPFCLSVQYVDYLHEKSDSLEIQVEDREGRWRNDWYPAKGDTLKLSLGYDGEALLPCGEFQIDELEFSGPPDVVAIRALGAGVTQAIRSKNTKGFEKKTLKDIAETIATDHGFSVVGDVPYIAIERITQHRETDLGFLRRIAQQYGAVFSVRGQQLVFHSLEVLEQKNSVFRVEREITKAFSLKDKAHHVYREAQARHYDPETKKVIEGTITAQGKKSGDVLRLRKRAENSSQAKQQAKAAMKHSSGRQTEGTLTLIGDPRLMAGANIDLGATFGVFKGLYQVTSSRHTLDRSSGYTTEIEVRRV